MAEAGTGKLGNLRGPACAVATGEAQYGASAYQREAQYEARRRAVAEAAEFELHHAARMAYPSSEGASAGSDALARLVRNGT